MGSCLSYSLNAVIKHHAKATYRRNGLFGTYGSRRVRDNDGRAEVEGDRWLKQQLRTEDLHQITTNK